MALKLKSSHMQRKQEISDIMESNVTSKKTKNKHKFFVSNTSKWNDLFAVIIQDSLVIAKTNSWCFLLKKQSLISANWITMYSETVLTKLGGGAMLMFDGKHSSCNWV